MSVARVLSGITLRAERLAAGRIRLRQVERIRVLEFGEAAVIQTLDQWRYKGVEMGKELVSQTPVGQRNKRIVVNPTVAVVILVGSRVGVDGVVEALQWAAP